ncbi:MAG: LysR family transcriptional regulator [Dethiobacter sp.]|nr:MAG: LysR family transcriptional regulator [Dethiobacter sp.]
MEFTPNSKIWIEKDGRKVFGDGPCDILKRIKRTGSLRMAAAEINMSYSQAWQLIKSLEKKLGFPLLIKKAGGESGGGSILTKEGEELTGRFEQFREEAGETLQQLFNKHFD